MRRYGFILFRHFIEFVCLILLQNVIPNYCMLFSETNQSFNSEHFPFASEEYMLKCMKIQGLLSIHYSIHMERQGLPYLLLVSEHHFQSEYSNHL
jgi:hypothetical protein